MNKRSLFVLAAIVLATAGFYSQSLSSKHAHSLALQLTSEDLSGSNTAPLTAQLQSYVKTHMGASVSYTLTGSYNRAVNAAKAATASDEARNSGIYAAAQAACMSHANSIVQAECNQAYITSHMQDLSTPATATAPSLTSYEYEVKSPFWTPDLSGALFLGALAALILAIVMRPRRYR